MVDAPSAHVALGSLERAAARVGDALSMWRPQLIEIAAACGVTAVATAVAWILAGRHALQDIAMIQILGIVIVATHWSLPPAILSVILSVLSYDFFFIPPYYSLRVDDGRHVVTFVVMFTVGVTISTLTQRIRDQIEATRAREERITRLYALSRELSSTRALERMKEVAARHLQEFFGGRVALLMPEPSSHVDDTHAPESVRVSIRSGRMSAPSAPSPRALFVPLVGSQGRVGVLGLYPGILGNEQRQMLETFASQIASALERAGIASEVDAARLEVEAERLRSSLLSSVSHDLRTPLAVITGAASTLLSEGVDPAAEHDLLSAIHEESVRLTRLVTNLLDMTRLAAGALKVNKEWQSIEAVVGAALRRVEDRLAGRRLIAHIPPNLPLVAFDAVLIEQVLINLLDNAAKYSPADAAIEVGASPPVPRAGSSSPSEVVLRVKDRGRGIPHTERHRIFEKFYRLHTGPASGAGLGLAICRGIVEAHGGRIGVDDRGGGGSVFFFTLPIDGSPPAVEED